MLYENIKKVSTVRSRNRTYTGLREELYNKSSFIGCHLKKTNMWNLEEEYRDIDH